jgi:uncharacterized protein YggE
MSFLQIGQTRWWLPLGALALVAFSAGCGHHAHSRHGMPSASAPVRGVTVSGVGKVSGKPDVARTTIGVEVRAGTAEEAINQVNARMAQVIAAVKGAGVADADVRTATLSLNFERSYEQPPRPVEAPVAQPSVAPAGAATGKPKAGVAAPEAAVAPPPKLPQGFYTASNQVEVTIRKLDDAGKVVSAATSAGADQLFGIRFELEDPSKLLVEARKRAVEDARERAERLAKLAGVTLGPAVSISEADGGAGPSPMPMFAAAKMQEAAPIERGEVTVVSTVQIVYALPE